MAIWICFTVPHQYSNDVLLEKNIVIILYWDEPCERLYRPSSDWKDLAWTSMTLVARGRRRDDLQSIEPGLGPGGLVCAVYQSEDYSYSCRSPAVAAPLYIWACLCLCRGWVSWRWQGDISRHQARGPRAVQTRPSTGGPRPQVFSTHPFFFSWSDFSSVRVNDASFHPAPCQLNKNPISPRRLKPWFSSDWLANGVEKNIKEKPKGQRPLE